MHSNPRSFSYSCGVIVSPAKTICFLPPLTITITILMGRIIDVGCKIRSLFSHGAVIIPRWPFLVSQAQTSVGKQKTEAILLGFQHYLLMFGTAVIIPTALVPQMGGVNEEKSKVIQTLLFVAGLNTFLWTSSRGVIRTPSRDSRRSCGLPRVHLLLHQLFR